MQVRIIRRLNHFPWSNMKNHFFYIIINWPRLDVCQRNNSYFIYILLQAITALAHLRAAILYIMDISEQCGHTLEEQIELFNGIKPLFANKPLLVVLNKVDVIRPEELSEEKKELLKAFEQDGKIINI